MLRGEDYVVLEEILDESKGTGRANPGRAGEPSYTYLG